MKLMDRTIYIVIASVLCWCILLLPINPSVSKALASESLVQSEAYVVIDSNSGKVLSSKNKLKEMYPASITKIVTAIMTIESIDINEKTTVSNHAVHADGTRVYLLEDEEITIDQLLHGLMVSSGNDAGIAIAEHVSGSVENFALDMNQFLREEVGVENTSLSNPHGLFDERHVTTALDMARISAYAMKNAKFRELVNTESYNWVGEGWETTLYNHHPLLRGNEEVIGIKNGFVTESGYTLATAAIQEDTEVIVVTLNSPTKDILVDDTLTLLNEAFSKYETKWLSFADKETLPGYIYPDSLPVTVVKGEKILTGISETGVVSVYGAGKRLIDKIQLNQRQEVRLPIDYLNIDKDVAISPKPERSESSFMSWLVVTGFLYFPLDK
ncbi:D-alanyl-D-alanine carboxypeptidase [Salipaludibacillus neizhouensis]|uniref:D-alanyl-D-alanine carboxypeptidase n=2 Tax=Salipaludibacillus neizhouensis TaxID=885475 RepID=A0A3A9KIK2_9BACI|nr:D-alanyl-D-alanine carboxypeptidase family protein [Salipaludibacillus neizhouensis]RKL67505.1 D-alanyl-D-alanine carboxypeptidase [Salipaludibacillus neizhouensis]